MTATARLTIDIPKKDHRKIKATANALDISMKELVMISLYEFMNRKPNKITEEAMQQVSSGKGIKSFDSFEDMMKELNA